MMGEPTAEQFEQVFDEYTKQLKAIALRLFHDGVAHDHCFRIAVQIADGIDLKQLRMIQNGFRRLVAPGMPLKKQ